MSNQDGSHQSEKNCTKTALKYSKSDERYWQNRIMFWNKTDKLYSVRMQHSKRTEVFKLHTANKKEASKKARDIFLSLKANGWDATFDEFKPKVTEVVDSPTIGDVTRIYLELTEASVKTSANYVRVLRSVVADIKRIGGDKNRFDYVNGGNEKWKAKVDNVLLSEITQAKVKKWRKRYVDARNDDPIKEASAKETVNSYIR